MARTDQIKINNVSYDLALPADSKDTMHYTTTGSSNAFAVTIPDVHALYDGLTIHVKFHAATADGCTLNVTGDGSALGAKRIEYRQGVYCTTHITAGQYVTLIYRSAGNSNNGTWVMQEMSSVELPIVTFSTTPLTNGTTIKGLTIGSDKYNFPVSGGSSTDTDTWRKIQLNGTDKLGTGINTNPLNIKAGTNMTITESGGTFTFAATDTTYESKSAASGGTAVSLCTTGEKYTWNSKQNALPTTTTANKVLISTTTSGTTKWSDFSSAGFLKTSNTGVVSVDTNTYLTSNQTITLSGAVTGSGTTSITTTLADSGVTAATYCGLTVNAKGIVTSAAKRYEHNIRIYYASSNFGISFKIINAKSDAYTYSTLTVSNNYGLYAMGFTSDTKVCPASGFYGTSSNQNLVIGVYGYNSTSTYRLYFRYSTLVTYSSSTATINNAISESTTYLTLTSSFTINDVVREI